MDDVTTRKMREVIRSRHKAGEPTSALAEDYCLSRSVVKRIILTEEKTADE